MSETTMILALTLALLQTTAASADNAAQQTAHTTEPVMVQTRHGPVKGLIDRALNGREYKAFLGLPYARPPIGELRFRNPVPFRGRWKQPRNAMQWAPPCPQHTMSIALLNDDWGQLIGNEDCLYLNVFTPQIEEGRKKLPVMVYFHFGAFMIGATLGHSPQGIMTEDVVLVIIQYRIGFLGLLSTEDGAAPGNFGLKDQVMSLRWVKDNIESFGGDPNSVTIFGESTGSSSVHMHMISDMSKGLFHRAIMHSGAANCFWSTVEGARERAYEMGYRLNCTESPDPNSVTSEELVRCLRTKSVQDIASSLRYFVKFSMYPRAVGAVVDGEFLKAHPIELMKKGAFNPVNLMTGFCKDEGALGVAHAMNHDRAYKTLKEELHTVAGPSVLGLSPLKNSTLERKISEGIFKEFFNESYNDPEADIETFKEMLSERLFKVCMSNADELYLNATATKHNNLYLFEFKHFGRNGYATKYNWDRLKDDNIPLKWISHVDDLHYVFPGFHTQKLLTDEREIRMARIMAKLWANFARTGNPTPDDSDGFTWAPATRGNMTRLALTVRPYMEEDAYKQRRELWNSFPLPDNIRSTPERFTAQTVQGCCDHTSSVAQKCVNELNKTFKRSHSDEL